jgi:hypothetical protein
MPPEDYGSFEDAIPDLVSGRSHFLDIEHRIRTKSGDWKWVLIGAACDVSQEQLSPNRLTPDAVQMVKDTQLKKCVSRGGA